MKTPIRAVCTAALLVALAAASSAQETGSDAAPGTWRVGTTIEPFALEDARGELGRVDDDVRLVLFVADMDGGDFVHAALEAHPELQDLGARGAVFVSDIHRMPGLVTTLFALPSMRRKPYRMLLDREPGPSLVIPREEGKVTVVRLAGGEVRDVAFVESADAVAAALEGEAP